MPPLVALGVENRPIDALGSFQQGQQAAIGADAGKLKNTQQAIEMIGSGALYALGGDINGEVDPAKYNEVLDGFSSMGLDVEKYRNNPSFAKVAAQASLTAMQRMQLAQGDRDYEMALSEFDAKLEQNAIENAQNERRLAIAEGNASAPNVPAGYRQTETGLEAIPGGPADPNNPINTRRTTPLDLSPTDKKAIWAAEDELPQIENSIETLKRAKELNAKTAEGLGANQFGKVGTYLPDSMEPESAAPTREYLDIMTQEAAAAMSQALKGATTDKELKIFMDIISDVSKPKAQRERALDRMITLAERHKERATARIKELRGDDGMQGGAAVPATTDAPVAAPAAANTMEIDGATYEQDENGDWYLLE